MPKNVIQDINTKGRRTIREMPLPRGRKRADSLEEDILYEQEVFEVTEEPPSSPWRRILLWGATIFFLVVLCGALVSKFTGAVVTIVPKTESVTVHHEFTASKDGVKLPFEILRVNETEEMLIPADTTKKVLEKATGTIVIYNNFSDKPQRLVRNTRFETPGGLIYRIDSSVTIPGRVMKDGRKVPGSLEAVVFADSPGVEYNIPPSDFTIPGFKTDPARFSGFYARSKTPLAGGLQGTVKIPTEGAIETARKSLAVTLKQKIEKKKQALVPPGYVLFAGAFTMQNNSLPPEERKGDLSSVREKMTGVAYLFKRTSIAKAIAEAALPSFNNLPIEIPDIDALVFEFKELPASSDAELKTIRFTLTGPARVVWLYDAKKLQEALVGKPKSELLAILSAFPTVGKAELVIRPFWSKTFPSNPKKIVIEVAREETASKTP